MQTPPIPDLAIECRGLWKLFGGRANEALAAMQRDGLTKAQVLEQFDCVAAVCDVSFSVARGEVLCIMGLSGSGKSTVLRHINGLVSPTHGQVLIDHTNITSDPQASSRFRQLRSAEIGMVFQHFGLLPHRSVVENAAFGLELRGVSLEDRLRIAEQTLGRVGLVGWSDRDPAQLSGGMQQRVGIARAIAGDPKILLMDEPFSALDPIIRRQLQDQFLALSRSLKKTTVFVTHDLEEAMRLGDRVAIMRDGAIIQIGRPEEILLSPADEHVAGFIGGMSPMHVLTVGHICRPIRPGDRADWQNRESLASKTLLADAIDACVANKDALAVVNPDGQLVGMVDAETLLSRLKPRGRGAHSEQEVGAAELKPREPDAVGVAEFVRAGATRYRRAFGQLDRSGLRPPFNAGAASGGSLWAAWRGSWAALYVLSAFELALLLMAAKSLRMGTSGALMACVTIFAVVRVSFGFLADRIYRRQYRRWRSERGTASGVSFARLTLATISIGSGYGLILYRSFHGDAESVLLDFPQQVGLTNGTTETINRGITWMTTTFTGFFDQFTALLRFVLDLVEALFIDAPWPVLVGVSAFIAYRRGGARLAIFTAAALAYMGIFGLWDKSMATIALVAAAVLVSLAVGLPTGLICAKSRSVRTFIEPILDVMQTLPTFVYLIPAVAFFSIGKPPGLIATVIFALPPVIRLTSLGIRQVPASVLEAADAFGATTAQRLWKIEVPLAAPSIRLGINQTIMMSLSMIVIAAMIGAGGLGQEVIHSLQYLRTGQGFIAGFAIVLVAMVLDRLVRRLKS